MMPNFQSLQRRLINFSISQHVPVQLVIKTAALLVCSQLVPEHTVLQGGGALTLQYPLQQVRFTRDLDLVVADSFDAWETEFRRNLEYGFSHFAGEMRIRGNDIVREGGHLPTGVKMYPRDVHLSFAGRPFALVPLDITAAMPSERQSKQAKLSAANEQLATYLGLNLKSGLTVLDPIQQTAQKMGALFYARPPRSTDLADITLIIRTMTAQDHMKVSEALLEELTIRGVSKPYNLTEPGRLKEDFLAAEYGTEEDHRLL
jgi:hypothetical protein